MSVPILKTNPHLPDRKYELGAMVLCAAVFFMALWIGSLRQIGNFDVESDFYGVYISQADNILKGRPYTYTHNPPGYVLLLAGVHTLTGDFFTAGKVISAVATALLGILTFLTFRALFDSRVALASTMLMLIAVFPHSFLAATDVLGAALMILPLWLLLRRGNLSWKACLTAGLATGLAYLVRSNALNLPVGIVISILILNTGGDSLKVRSKWTAVYLVGFLFVVSPWLVYNWNVNGSPMASTAYKQIAANTYTPGSYYSQTGVALQEAGRQFGSLKEVILHDPVFFIRKYVRAVALINPRKMAGQGMGFPAYLLAGGGILVLLADLNRRRSAFLVTLVLGYLVLGLVGFHIRYYLFLFPMLFLIVGYFVFHQDTLKQIGRFTRFPLLAAWFIIVLLSSFLLRDAIGRTRIVLASEPDYLIDTAEFLRNRGSEGEILALHKPHLAYLAKMKNVIIQGDTAEEFLRKAREAGARYIVYSDLDAKYWRGLRSLSDPEKVPVGLDLVYRHDPSHTLIYEVSNPESPEGSR